MAKKINMTAVKEFLFNHGEKVALATCGFLAVVFATLGLMRAMGAGNAVGTSNTWTKEMDKYRSGIMSSIGNAPKVTFDEKTRERMDENTHVFKHINSNHRQSPYNSFPNEDDIKRFNPLALSIKTDEKGKTYMQLDYVSGLVWVYEKDATNSNLRGLVPLEGGDAGGMPKGIGGGPGVGGKDKDKGKGAVYYPPLRAARAERLVVVTAVFPMKEQMEEFKRKLKVQSQTDLYVKDKDGIRDDLPKPLGINVVRYEVVNNKPVDSTAKVIIGWDPKHEKIQKSEKLHGLLQMAFYDEQLPETLKYWLWEGFHTPMPRLANAKYPRFNLHGFDIAWEDEKGPEIAGGPGPMPPGKETGPTPGKGSSGGGPKIPGAELKGKDKDKGPATGNPPPSVVERDIKNNKKALVLENDKPLHHRLFLGQYNLYHILGLFQDDAAPVAKSGVGQEMNKTTSQGDYFNPWHLALPGESAEGGVGEGGAKPPVGPGPGPGPGKGFGSGGFKPKVGDGPGGDGKGPGGGHGGAIIANWDRDAIVRFVDPDVLPGKAYVYGISVVLANPNFGKKDKVAYNSLADAPFLYSSGLVFTRTIAVPPEQFLYCIDQRQLDDMGKTKDELKKAGPVKYDPDEVAFQLQKWTGETGESGRNDRRYVIGDWTIAERVLIRRGQMIGKEAVVYVPAWYKEKDDFEVPHKIEVVEKVKKAKEVTYGKGFKMDFYPEAARPLLVDFAGGKRLKSRETNQIEEDTAVDALILTPDGKLSLINSRIDSESKDRHDRVERSRQRVQEVMGRASAVTDDKNPMNPKVPGGKAP